MVSTESGEETSRSKRTTWVVVGVVLVLAAIALVSTLGNLNLTDPRRRSVGFP